jgi:PAS domain S-box-containing protein
VQRTNRSDAAPSRRSSTSRGIERTLGPLDTALGEQLFLHVPEAVVVSDMGSERILRWNSAAERLFGYAAIEAVGKPIDMLLHTSVARLHDQRIAQYVASGNPDVLTGEAPLAVAVRTEDGATLWLDVSLATLEIPGTTLRLVVLWFRPGRRLPAEPQPRT